MGLKKGREETGSSAVDMEPNESLDKSKQGKEKGRVTNYVCKKGGERGKTGFGPIS